MVDSLNRAGSMIKVLSLTGNKYAWMQLSVREQFAKVSKLSRMDLRYLKAKGRSVDQTRMMF